eukprot:SRR837773.7242.p1 GENE.SRR837773.7242~~SRR837773.7242.p1  ORF type:complete len:667 (-),score=98.60 SRR837773.7242:128-1993(-)
MEQDEAEHSARQGEIHDQVDDLKHACEELDKAMAEVVEVEAQRGCVSSEQRRSSARVAAAAKDISALLEDLRANTVTAGHPCAQKGASSAERALERLELWRNAPEIHHMLLALRSKQAQTWLSDDQKAVIEKSYQDFSTRCQELKLGFLSTDAEGRPKLLRVPSGEELNVKVSAPNLYDDAMSLPLSVWVTPHCERPELFEPGIRETTSYSRAFDEPTGALPVWQEAAEKLSSQPKPLEQELASGPSRRFGGRAYSEHFDEPIATCPNRSRPQRPLLPIISTPPEALPGITVRRFSCGLGCLWVIAGIVQLAECIQAKGADISPYLHGDVLDVRWPPPARLFQVAWMACDATRLVVNNMFSLYAAAQEDGGAWTSFSKLADAAGPGSISCSELGCDVLSFDRRLGWSLRPTADLGPNSTLASAKPQAIALPEAWRVVAAARAPCLSEPDECQELVLAGWDGESVVIAGAALTVRQPSSTLEVSSRFALRRLGSQAAPAGTAYSNVLALHFGKEGRTLMVLSEGGGLEAWDLAEGRRVGLWQLEAPRADLQLPHAMCHDGTHLVLAHASSKDSEGLSPPSLSRVALPPEVLELERSCSRDGGGCEGHRQSANDDVHQVVVVV